MSKRRMDVIFVQLFNLQPTTTELVLSIIFKGLTREHNN